MGGLIRVCPYLPFELQMGARFVHRRAVKLVSLRAHRRDQLSLRLSGAYDGCDRRWHAWMWSMA